MRIRILPLTLLLALAPMAQAHDHGWHRRDDDRRSSCWEDPRWSARARWEERERWAARERWERRRRWEDCERYGRDTCPPWEREATFRIPAPTFHVRIQLP
ncbi:MAG TPA: hypothetical protein VJ623_09445 [Holophagaceae bacterium]|nr:hypothetical protein [Holophagaceae bacterium]HJW32263.1 hypothetical protein [Holophagaceae bacterium]